MDKATLVEELKKIGLQEGMDIVSLYRKELEENPFKLHGLER